MNAYQLILSHISAILFSFTLFYLGKVFVVHKKMTSYVYFSVATFGGSLFVLFGLLLSFSWSDVTILNLHRARIFFLMVSFAAWLAIIYEINFVASKVPKTFFIITGLFALTVPFNIFLGFPVEELSGSLGRLGLTYHSASGGLAFQLYALVAAVFCGYTLIQLITTSHEGPHGLFSRIALLCAFLGGIHDYGVRHGFINNIFIGEFLCTAFLLTIYVVLLFDEEDLQKKLERLNKELAGHHETLESEVMERTWELEVANRKMREEMVRKEEAEKGLKKAHGLLERRVEEKTVALKDTYRQLLHAEKLSAVGKLSASVAHEFGSPIVAIRLFLLQILMKGGLTKQESEMAAMAIKECDRIKGLIQNMQDFNRPTSGKSSAVDLHEVIDSMTLLSNKNFIQKNIKLIKSYAPDLPKIWGVEDQLKQVVLNLFNNATQAMGSAGGTLSISTMVVGNMVQLAIADTGKGIKQEHQDSIFQPFFSTKAEVEGTGLGLAVIYGIIKRHNGKIDVVSREGRGTTMTIRLPAYSGQGVQAVAG
ncbi:MAG: ATP-binding protein [Thermodesulfobacteriota bacterium]